MWRHARRCAAAALIVVIPAGVVSATPAAPPAAATRVHEVVAGDTLSGIAKHYGVSVDAIVAVNRLASPKVRLRLHQRLVIPAAVASPSAPAAARPPSPSLAGAVQGASPDVPSHRARSTRPASLASRARSIVPKGPVDLILAVPDFFDTLLSFLWPTDGPVTSTFGRRHSGWHRGIDIKAERGTAVTAAAAGVVTASDLEPRYGRVVKIEHPDGFVTVYAHNEENLVAPGDQVQAGQRIASAGHTGRATSDHVHFEIRRDGRVYNPLYMLPLPPQVAQIEEGDGGEEDE
jgi:murein DD-endopeptidase MepM/ murein hydrolase activator NlpD